MKTPVLLGGKAKDRLPKWRLLVAFSRRYVWRALKYRVTILLGGKARLDEEALFFRQSVLHLAGLQPMRQITCPGLRGEGAGSQALMLMRAINFARSSGLTYVHTPFTKIEHADRPMEEWAIAWETFFNLGSGEVACDSPHDAINFSSNFNNLERCLGWRHRGNELAEHFKTIVPEFRRKYYLNKSPRTSDDVTVAVHIRRGDALPDNPQYFTSNETVLRTVTAVKRVLDLRQTKYSIRIYSQGNRADFAELYLPGLEFFLDADAIWTMGELIEADILVMAKGCFSYCAALLSDGIKIGDPDQWSVSAGSNWIPPEGWICCRADGSFDSADLERQLALLIQAKAHRAAPARSGGSEQRTIEAQTVARLRLRSK